MNLFAAKPMTYLLMLLNLPLAITIFVIEPDKWIVLPLGGLLLPIVYAAIRVLRPRCDCDPESMGDIYENLAMGALLLTSSLGITLTNITGFASGDLSDRFGGAILGMLIVFFGNRMPKQSPTCADERRISLSQRVHRRAGYTMVISGLLMIAVWVVLPIDIAQIAFISIGIVMLLIIFAFASQLRRKHETIPG